VAGQSLGRLGARHPSLCCAPLLRILYIVCATSLLPIPITDCTFILYVTPGPAIGGDLGQGLTIMFDVKRIIHLAPVRFS